MMRRALALGAALTLFGFLGFGVAHAQDDDEEEYYFEKEGAAYMSVFAGGGYFDDRNKGSGGGGLLVGVHVSPYVAMEGMWEMESDSSTQMGIYSFKLVPIPDSRVQPYVKLGAGLLGSRPGHDFLFMGRFGAGVQVFLDEYMAVGIDAAYGKAAHSNDIYLGNLFFTYYFE